MIDLTLPAPKIAEELIKEFELFLDSPSNALRSDATEIAIKAIEIALQFCPPEIKEWSGAAEEYFDEPNPDYTKLSEVLRCLKEK